LAQQNNENKDVLDIKNELTELQKEISGVLKKADSLDNKEVLSEVTDLKRRVDLMEKEFKKLSEALKNTLVDVRALVTELDNPFNMLRSIGVDKLFEKAMEKAEEEINKAKKEELSKRIAKKALGEDKDKNEHPPIVVKAIPTSSQHTVEATSTTEKIVNSKGTRSNKPLVENQKITKNSVSSALTNENDYKKSSLIKRKHIANTPTKFLKETIPLEGLENVMTFKKSKKHKLTRQAIPLINSHTRKLTSLKIYDIPRIFLVSSYLLATLGMNNAISLLSEYVSRNWISSRTMGLIVNVMRMLASYSPKLMNYEDINPNLSVEDHVFILSLIHAIENSDANSDILFALLISKLLHSGFYLDLNKGGER